MRSELGIATVMIQSTPNPGKIAVRAEAQGLAAGLVEFESQPLTQAVVKGRDVGRMPAPRVAGTLAAASNERPAQMPDAAVMEAQRKSQEARDEKSGK
ncbi:MAG: hypothetical protein NTX50_25330 [Candidatus Sumerlaeota bacterium]|nr:hypothetical protein [Candidatus Sumerlaeota bacterium]